MRFYKEFDNIVRTEEAKNCKKRRVQKNPDPNARALQFTLPSLKMLRPLEVLKDIETRNGILLPKLSDLSKIKIQIGKKYWDLETCRKS